MLVSETSSEMLMQHKNRHKTKHMTGHKAASESLSLLAELH